MTRGEILDFLNEFSRNSRVSRSGKADGGIKDIAAITPSGSSRRDETKSARPKIPNDESPLNYGYPMSSNKQSKQLPESTTPATIFVTLNHENATSNNKHIEPPLRAVSGRGGLKKSIVPSVDLNAYAKFKKIPEARNVKIDDDMKSFLDNFGLLDTPKSGRSVGFKAPQRRNDENVMVAAVTESVDEKLLKSILAETTGNGNANVSKLRSFDVASTSSSSSDHVFNPSNSNVKIVDVNRIAKIVENIRLLTDDNNTVSLTQDAFQKKLENITAAIATIDQPTVIVPSSSSNGSGGGGGNTGDNNKTFNGYEVFFDDDDSKEVDSELPESPTDLGDTEPLNKAQNPPDPLSTDELQQLVEKNKNDVKRQEPGNDTSNSVTVTSSEASISTSSETVDLTTVPADSTSEGTSVEVTSNAGESRVSPTTAATDINPSLSQLAESFGGGDTASSPPATGQQEGGGGGGGGDGNTTVPSRPKNGLYFYVDWNTFLTVNQGQNNQVNLRFAPKAGNPAHFFRITVP